VDSNWSKNGRKEVKAWKDGEKVSLLEEIRETEAPGKRGDEFVYARAIYGYFSEIEKLKAEGFTLTTICRFLEKKEILPAGSDPRSFCRAFRRRREAASRKQPMRKEAHTDDTAKKTVTHKRDVPKHETAGTTAGRKPEVSFTPARPKNTKTGLQINPDNTFEISPIDPEDLP
jgi:hypothetical protein